MFDQSLHSAQFMGIVNALRTGDPTVDMVAALLLPVFVRVIFKEAPRCLQAMTAYFRKKKPKESIYSRTITYRTSQTQCGSFVDIDSNSQNAQLIRAVHLYVHNNCELTLKDANIDLMEIRNSSQAAMRRNGGSPTPAGVLDECQLVEHPLPNTWHSVGSYGDSIVQLCTSDSSAPKSPGQGKSRSEGSNEGEKSEHESKTHSLQICLRSKGGAGPINQFLHTALSWYVLQIKKLDNKDRYFFDVQPSSYAGRRGSAPSFKAYKLGDEKTFETLFSQQSRALLKIVDQFQAKTGKYAIKGYPYKLGLLLSGPPGTGKTSLIKALAHYTGRHIVNVPLSRIESNTQLTNIFFNKNYMVSENSPPLQLDFEKMIYVLEDVDASTDAVKKRRKKKPNTMKLHAKSARETPSSPPGASTSSTRALTYLSDSLDLSGLLNVLDGVVETPGRIVIMTTNHPEVLDPALIRPGRIDKKLVMGPLLTPDAILMIEHYYQTSLSNVQKEQLGCLLNSNDLEVTPAELEQLAMEKDSVELLIGALTQLKKSKTVSPIATAPNTSSEEDSDTCTDVSKQGDNCEDTDAEMEQPGAECNNDHVCALRLENILDDNGDY